MFVSGGVVDLLPTFQHLDCMQAVNAAERRPAEWDLSHKEFCISDLPSRLVSDKMWIFECVFIPRVAAFDHSFLFQHMWHSGISGQICMILEQLLLAKEKKNKMQKHINYPHFNIYSGLHTVIVDTVIWKIVMLTFLLGATVGLLKLLQLWIKFNTHSLWRSLYFYILWYPVLCAWLTTIK